MAKEDKITVKVLRTFRNKYSKSLHKVGDLLLFRRSDWKKLTPLGTASWWS